VKEGIVLGHKISKEGIKIDKAKVDVISKLPHPTTIKGIHSFLGHAGFHQRFIKDFSKIDKAKADDPTAPIAKSLASHMSSKGKSQSGAIKIGASCQPKNHDYYDEQNSCYDSNSFGFDQIQTPQYTVNHQIFNAHNDLLNSQNKLMEQMTSMCEMVGHLIQKKQEEKQIQEDQAANTRYWKIPAYYDDDDDYNFAIIPNEIGDSLIMGDEHLNTILAMKSDEFIKSSVENLVPNPSESEGENGCDMLACFTTFSNILFDAEYEFDSVDDQSLHNEDFLEEIFSNPLFEEEINSIRIGQDHFNADSDLIGSLLNHDSSIIPFSSKIDSFLDEFAGELPLLKSILQGIDETDYHPENEIRLSQRLL
nr:retrovirus-related Pol polyprotein from transposon opus [Tanacetum cinerariifolium]